MRKLLAYGTLLMIVWIPLVLGNDIESKLTDKSLDEIVITATRTKHSLKDLSGNVSLIPLQELIEANAFTIDEVLTYQVGIDMQAGKFLGSKTNLNMRGLQGKYGAQRVLVLMDGRPINEEYLGDVDFRSIPVDSIEKVEIVRGPTSALYGSNAMGGVINLISKRQTTTKPFVELKTFTGSFNTYGTNLQHGLKIGNLDYFITANDEITDGYLKNSDGSLKDWQTGNFTGKLTQTLSENNNITLSLGKNNGRGNDENFIMDLTRDFQDIVYNGNWSNQNQADFLVRIYRNGLTQDLEWKFAPTGKYDQYTLGSQLQQTIKLIPQHLFTVGIDTKKEDVMVDETNGIINETINSSAVYLQDEISFTEKFLITLGVRYDRHEEFGGETSPRVGAVYHLNEQATIRSAIGKAYRAPTVSDLYLPKTSYWGMTFEGNPNLEPESLWSVEAGLDYKFTKDLSSRLTVYQSLLKDAWDHMKDPDNIYRPHNVTQMSITGIETEMKYNIIEGLNGFVNYTLNRAKYKEDETNPLIEGNYVEDVPISQGSLGLRFHPGKSNTTINMKLSGSSRRYTDPENTQNNKLPKYLVTDIDITTKVNENSNIFISVNNLFNREYKETVEYAQPGRWFSAGVSLRF